MHAEVILLNGGSAVEAEKTLTNDEIKEITDRKWLEILDKTQKKFQVNDDIELKLKIKNISSVRVKIYTVNLEKVEL